MSKIKATVYRSYEIELEFDSTDVPEMIDPNGKAEWLSREYPMSEWTLIDVASDAFVVSE